MSAVAIGIVGCGKIARDQHLPAIAANEGFNLVAVADPSVRHATLPSFRSLEEMLEAHREIEAVALCMPPPQRAAAAREAIHLRKHVLLEKPPCSSLLDAWELVAMAQKTGTTLFTAWHSQFGAAVTAARDWLKTSPPRSIRVSWKEDVKVWHPGQAWIWKEGGFGVFDPGINALSILTAILPGELKLADAELSVPVNCATPIAARLSLSVDGRVPVSAEFDFRQTGPQTWDIEIETDGGPVRLGLGGNRLEIAGEPQEVGEQAEYGALYDRFLSLIRKGESEVDLAPLRIVDDALASGRVVRVAAFEE